MRNIVKSSLLIVLWIAAAAVAQEPETPAGAASSPREASPDGVRQASLILGDLAEQMRIAGAKLQKSALARKKQIGRLEAYQAAADEQAQVLAGETQRLLERHQQVAEQLENLGQLKKSRGVDDARLKALITESQAAVNASQARLERVARHRSQLQTKIDALKLEHLTELLEAGIRRPAQAMTLPSAVERLLELETQSLNK